MEDTAWKVTHRKLVRIFFFKIGLVGFELRLGIFSLAELFTSAADSAMAAMKGRLANKYYALAEEMNALIDADE